MAEAHGANESVPEQGLRPQFRACRLGHNAGFQIDGSVAKRRAVLVRLLQKTQPHAGRFLADASNESGSECLDKAIAGAQREGAVQPFEVKLLSRTEERLRLLDKRTDAF